MDSAPRKLTFISKQQEQALFECVYLCLPKRQAKQTRQNVITIMLFVCGRVF